ncbi:MAG TPA: nicotinate-nucleotide adenylyltransferase [Pyrinomonadaceae bacterium]|nr:nicotinate-nucleotide adenylyltransferase [Pyrinomonadaceae bacterium]
MAERRVAIYGGSFDPVHDGHLALARELVRQFAFDELHFVPAHHAPHKRSSRPTSAWHRYAMLALATQDDEALCVSAAELEAPERPYTVETIARLRTELGKGGVRLFFVMGADSWAEITTWREWERLLSMADTVVVTRPGYELALEHVTEEARARVRDVRGAAGDEIKRVVAEDAGPSIFFSDAVKLAVSSTDVRRAARELSKDSEGGGRAAESLPVPRAVAGYIEKYRLYTDKA